MTTRTQQNVTFPAFQPYMLLLLGWVLAMIAVPIVRWTWGDDVIPKAAVITTVMQFAAVLALLVSAWGLPRGLRVLLIVAVCTWGVEFIGSKTGIPFGEYQYTDVLQPQLLGVPLVIPLAWFMMLGPSWAVAAAILNGRGGRLAFAAVSALAITAWDLFLDPQMVGWGFWVWAQPEGGYFGIPWLNYFGWLLTGFVVTLIARPDRLPVLPLLVIYAVVWSLQSIGLALFWGQPGPAFWGSLVMGSLLLLATARLTRQYRQAQP